MKKMVKWIFGAVVVAFALLQFTNPTRTNPPVVHDFLAANMSPLEITGMFRAACYDCHSYETKWPWYSHVAPVSWLVASDVKEARRYLNFSEWPIDDPDRAASRLENISEQLGYKEMPPVEYKLMHPAAWLTTAQREQLIQWVNQKAAQLKAKGK
jgi:hypothetical protein